MSSAAAEPAHCRAARGDGEAFAALAASHYQRGVSGIEPAIIAYARAAEYARLAAMSRGSRHDWMSFLYLLDQHAELLRTAGLTTLADAAQGEAVALAEYMADDGDEEMSQLVAASADGLTPEVLNIARDLRGIVGVKI